MRRNILATPQELESLRDRVRREPYEAFFEKLQSRCALILETPPQSQSHWWLLAQQGASGVAVSAARTSQGRILDLAIAHRIEPNKAYRDRAIEEFRNLVSWQSWIEPGRESMGLDLCTAEAGVAVVLGLDLLYDELGEPDRLRAVQALRKRVIDPYRKAVADDVWWYNCYHSWNAVINSSVGLVALALGDDDGNAGHIYRLARSGLGHFFDALGREGGWDEGPAYWGLAMRYVCLLGEAAACLDGDLSVFHQRGMDATGLFPIYFTPNGHSAAFGDSRAVPLYGGLYLLVKRFGLKELAWWLDTYSFHRDVSTTGYSAAAFSLLFRPPDAETSSLTLSPVKVFHEIGWAAIADSWPKPAFYISAKTGDLAASHSQRDMNAIQLQVDGELMLGDMAHGSHNVHAADSDGVFDAPQAPLHNTLTVGGRDHRMDAQGSVIEAQQGDGWRWVACDAGNALGEDARAIRHVVLICASAGRECALVLDEVTNAASEAVQTYWHSPFAFKARDGILNLGTVGGARPKLFYAVGSDDGGPEVRRLAHEGRRGETLCVTSNPGRRLLLGATFSRHNIASPMEIRREPSGVTVVAGDVTVRFGRGRGHLTLKDVQG